MVHDSYGQIKIRVEEDYMGNVTLTPISERRRREVSRSNAYDGSYDVYLQHDTDIEQFMQDYPRATMPHWLDRGKRRINDGVIILMDAWTYRQMVGGQSD